MRNIKEIKFQKLIEENDNVIFFDKLLVEILMPIEGIDEDSRDFIICRHHKIEDAYVVINVSHNSMNCCVVYGIFYDKYLAFEYLIFMRQVGNGLSIHDVNM